MKKYGPIELPVKISDTTTRWFRTFLYIFEDDHYHVLTNTLEPESSIQYLRVESACTFAHLYGSRLCDCEIQLRKALRTISQHGGVLVYALDQHGRGIGLVDHFKVYELEQTGFDTVASHLKLGREIDARDYSHVLEILKDLGIEEVHLLTNNPARLEFFKTHLKYVKRVPIQPEIDGYNVTELAVKKEKMGHSLALKSDIEWYETLIGTKPTTDSFHIVRRAMEYIYSGDLKQVLERIRKFPRREDEFYTIYFNSTRISIDTLIEYISDIRSANEREVILRVAFIRTLSDKRREKLNDLVDRKKLFEIKILAQ